MSSSRKARAGARLAAVQALYQMDVAATPTPDVFAQFESHWIGREVEGVAHPPAEIAFFHDLVDGVVREQLQIDPLIDEVLASGWPLKRIEMVLRALLRAGCYELMARRDIPVRVVISQYVDVAGAFLEDTETAMANAVLDGLARRLRPEDFAGDTVPNR